MKVLFVYPDFYIHKAADGHLSYEAGGWYNEGLASLSATLKQHGHETALCHLLCPPRRADFEAELCRQQPDLVAFSMRSDLFRVGAECAQWAKELGHRVILGGCHATLAPEEAIAAPAIDMICLGEGEVPLATLCDRLGARQDPYDIPSLWFKRDGELVRNPVGPVVENLDELPIPDFGLFDFSQLISTQTFTAFASFTRGCPYNCTYCCNQVLRSIYPNRKHWLRTRSPQNAIRYLHALKEHYPEARYLRINDDIFHWDEDWLEEFGRLYRADFAMPLAVHHRPNIFSERAARLLREMGCYQIYFGVESGNQYIRNDVLRRHMTNAQIEQAFDHAHRAGMITTAYNMVGLPFENMARALDTVKMNARIGADRMLNPIFCPYRNTDLYNLAVQEGFIPAGTGYEDEAICDMGDYGPDEIKFVCTNFKLFVGLYKAAYHLPAPLKARAERSLDNVFLSQRLPYGALTTLADARRQASEGGKRLVRRYMPGLYILARDRLLRNRAQ